MTAAGSAYQPTGRRCQHPSERSGRARRTGTSPEDTIADVEASGLRPGKIVTQISQAAPFWPAEAEDQDYPQRHPDGYTCHFPAGLKAATP